MPGRDEQKRRGEMPRTDLPPEKDPYYEGYFGTDEEEGVVREHEAPDERSRKRDERKAEDAGGGDREI